MMNQTNETQNISENMKNAAAVLAASAGTYGNVYVGNALIGENPKLNVADRGFLFVQPGLSIGAGSRQLSVNLIYNSKLGNVQSLCGGMPAGWKLDTHQFLKLDGTDSSNVSTYKYLFRQPAYKNLRYPRFRYLYLIQLFFGHTAEYICLL